SRLQKVRVLHLRHMLARREAPAAQPEPTPSPTNGAKTDWVARCASASRQAPLECAIEETAVLTKTGQLIVPVNIRVAKRHTCADRCGATAAWAQPAGRCQTSGG